MIKIGYRTAKTAIGTALSISIAQWLGLHNFASAGIITLLCIQVTKKKIVANGVGALSCVRAGDAVFVRIFSPCLPTVDNWAVIVDVYSGHGTVEYYRRDCDKFGYHSSFLCGKAVYAFDRCE